MKTNHQNLTRTAKEICYNLLIWSVNNFIWQIWRFWFFTLQPNNTTTSSLALQGHIHLPLYWILISQEAYTSGPARDEDDKSWKWLIRECFKSTDGRRGVGEGARCAWMDETHNFQNEREEREKRSRKISIFPFPSMWHWSSTSVMENQK